MLYEYICIVNRLGYEGRRMKEEMAVNKVFNTTITGTSFPTYHVTFKLK